MTNDEQLIRNLIAQWHAASGKGDIETVLGLMAQDVVFLVPGKAPMRGRDEFADGFRNVTQKFRMESTGDVQEIEIAGDWAYCWTQLSVTMTPLEDGSPVRRSGPTLSIFRKNSDGSWALFRDANLLDFEGPGGRA
jgi:uncharacterized protein (TIGR02246 family)